MDVVSLINRLRPDEMTARQAARPLDRALFLLLVVSPLGVTAIQDHELGAGNRRPRVSGGSSDQQAGLRSTRPVSQPPARRPSLKHVAALIINLLVCLRAKVGSTARVAEEVDQCR
jgi:hypothetical protein